MNLLAHCFLSDNQSELLVGNFLGDFVRKKDIEDYPLSVKKGVWLHHEIDYFTDHDFWARQSRRRLAEHNHYARVIVDILYDYLLSANWKKFTSEPLEHFSKNVYKILADYKDLMPAFALNTFNNMRNQDWLTNYQYIEGLKKALSGMDHRSSFATSMVDAVEKLKQDYESFENDFLNFFPRLIEVKNDFLKKYCID